MICRQPWTLDVLDVPTEWKGLEEWIVTILDHFKINCNTALEFGVDYGYSTKVFSHLFKKVIGVDSFERNTCDGKEHDEAFYNQVLNSFANTNVEIVKTRFEDYINQNNENFYNMIHIDAIHDYGILEPTIRWAVEHSDITLVHDTMEYREVKRACMEIRAEKNLRFLSIPFHCGLGILLKSSI